MNKFTKYATTAVVAVSMVLSATAAFAADAMSGTMNSSTDSAMKACIQANQAVRLTYREAVAANNKAFYDSSKTARDTRYAAVSTARDAYQAALKTARNNLNAALAAATDSAGRKAARDAYKAA